MTAQPITSTRRAVIYVRISQDRTGDALGVARQRKDCVALCKRFGFDVVAIHEDNDITASKRKVRPAYREVMAMLGAGVADTIVVWHLDRLYRDARELEDLLDLVEGHNIMVATVTGGDYDLTTSDGCTMARVVNAFAIKEGKDKARRVARKHLEMAEAGRVGGGPRPFGWNADKKTLHPIEAPLLREAVDRVLAGETLHGIAVDWNSRNITTANGKVWRSSTLRMILTLGRIAGIRTHNGEAVVIDGKPVMGEWEPIIDAKTFARVGVLINGRSLARVPRQAARRYLLSGLLVCGKCQHKMVSRPRYGGAPGYACNPDTGGCGGVTITGGPLEAWVEDQVIDAFNAKRVLKVVKAGAIDRREAIALAELQEANTASDAIAAMFANPTKAGMTARQLSIANQAVQERVAEAEAAYHAVVADMVVTNMGGDEPGALVKLLASGVELSLDQRRAIMASAVDAVTVNPTSQRGGNRFDYSRISIAWRE